MTAGVQYEASVRILVSATDYVI